MDNMRNIDDVQEHLKAYIQTRYELLVLQASEKAATAGSGTVMGLILGVLVLLFMLFASVAAGFYLSSLLKSYSLGFLCLAGIYLFLAVILYVFRQPLLLRPLRDKIIKELFAKE